MINKNTICIGPNTYIFMFSMGIVRAFLSLYHLMFYRFFRISLGFPCLLSCPWACPAGPVCWNVPFGSGMGIGGAGTAAWHWPFMAWRKVDSWSRTWLYMLSAGRCMDIMSSGTAHAKHDCNCIAAHGSPEVPNPMALENLLRAVQILHSFCLPFPSRCTNKTRSLDKGRKSPGQAIDSWLSFVTIRRCTSDHAKF